MIYTDTVIRYYSHRTCSSTCIVRWSVEIISFVLRIRKCERNNFDVKFFSFHGNYILKVYLAMFAYKKRLPPLHACLCSWCSTNYNKRNTCRNLNYNFKRDLFIFFNITTQGDETLRRCCTRMQLQWMRDKSLTNEWRVMRYVPVIKLYFRQS